MHANIYLNSYVSISSLFESKSTANSRKLDKFSLFSKIYHSSTGSLNYQFSHLAKKEMPESIPCVCPLLTVYYINVLESMFTFLTSLIYNST